MKKTHKLIPYIFFIFIFSANIYLFMTGIKLGDEINRYERETKGMLAENTELEKKLYKIESLEYAASQAARLNFTKKATPLYLDSLGIALNK